MNNTVSVVVITYNSSEFITETLDSIYQQTYPYIELIISDDCSTDNTISICKEWIEHIDKQRFSNIVLLTSQSNTGIAPNLNRGLKQATGRWIKPFAGDDILIQDALESYVAHMTTHPDITYLFGKVQAFGTDTKRINEINTNILYEKYFNMTAKEQYNCLVLSDFHCFPFPAPAFFYDKTKHDALGITIDEDIPYIEDLPLYINITKRGYKLHLIDKFTVNYRACNKSIQSKDSTYNKAYELSLLKIWYKFKIKYHFSKQFKEHPRLSIIQYIKGKQRISNNHFYVLIEKIARFFDPIYRKLRGSNTDDWDR